MKNSHTMKSLLSVFIALVMALSSLNVIAFATEENGTCETHSWDDGTVITEASCLTEGEIKYICTVCAAEKTEKTGFGAHQAVTLPAVAATCVSTGLTEGKQCSVCDEILTAQTVVPMAAHNYDDGTVVADSTCSSVGEMLYVCLDCSAEKREEIALKEHNFDYDNGVMTLAPTCTALGEMTYTCADCGETTTEDIAMSEHTVVIDPAVAATCTATGLTEGSHCSACGEVLVAQEVVEMLPHTEIVSVKGVPATCTTPGQTDEISCSVCKAVLEEATLIKYTGHDFSEKIVDDQHLATAATCIAPATYYYDCANADCGEIGTETFADGDTDPSNHTNTVVIPRLDATCTEIGYEEYTLCNDCSAEIDKKEIPAKGHAFEKSEVIAPTCTARGYTVYVCANDSSHKYNDDYVDALGHSPVTDAAVAPTCITVGYEEGSHCETCNEILVAQVEIPMLEHDYTGAIVSAPNDTHSFMCVNGCNKSGGNTPCVDDSRNCVCDVCGYPMSHREIIVDEKILPTCISVGYEEGSHCGICASEIVVQEVIPMLEHDYSGEVVVCENDTHKIKCVNGCDLFCEPVTCVDEDKNCICDICSDPIEHRIITVPRQEPGCTEPGYEEWRCCEVCGYVDFAAVEIAPTGHSYVVDERVLPTCTTDGLDPGIHCEYCNLIVDEQIVIPATNHENNKQIANRIEPTCTESGLDYGTYCGDCGKVLVEQAVIPALGHNDEGVIDGIEATCVTAGITEGRYCTRCDEIVVAQEFIPALDHEYCVNPYVAPTCNEEGKEAETYCSRCRKILVGGEAIPATGHSFTDAWTLDKEATCTEAGEKSHHCENPGCDERTAITVIPAMEHDDAVIPAVAPTCTETGLTEGSYCKRCEETLVPQNVIPATDHSFEAEWTVVVPATCSAEGTETNVCVNCQQTISRSIEMLPHTPVNGEEVLPTCISVGYTGGLYCQICEAELEARTEIPMLDHSYTGEIKAGDNLTHSYKCVNGCNEYGNSVTCTDTNSDCKCECGNQLPHTEEIIAAVAATCITTGLTEGKKCSVCGEITLDQEATPVLEHSYTADVLPGENDTHSFKCKNGCELYGEAVDCIDENSDCICDVCNDAMAHLFDEGAWVITSESTCTQQGTRTNNCLVCKSEIVESLPLKEHNYGEGTVKTEPSCCTVGEMLYTCLDCEATKTEEIATVEHKYEGAALPGDNDTHTYMCIMGCELYGNPTDCVDENGDCVCDVCADGMSHTEITVPAVAPTCTQTGLTEGKKCEVCGEIIVPQETVPVAAHNFGEWEEVTAATCIEEGSKTRKCTDCEYIDTASIPVSEHKYSSSWTVDKGATCTEKGSKSKHCTQEGCTAKTDITSISAKGHSYTSKVTKKATYKETGVTTYTCSVCAATYTKDIARVKLGKVDDLRTTSSKKTYVSIKWDKVDGAEKYQVYQYIGKSWKKITETKSNSFKVKSLKSGTTYKFKVRAIIDDSIVGSFSSVHTTKTRPSKTSVSLKAGTDKITVSWKKVTGAEGYEIQYSTSSKMKNAKTETVTKGSTTKKTIKKLKTGKKYYFKVRAYVTVNGKKVYADWSSVKNLKAK